MKQLLFNKVAIGERLDSLIMDISTTAVITGAMASRDYSPLHHNYHYVTTEAGHRDIFLNTPHQANIFERFLSDWSGSRGRLGRMGFKMKASVYAGDNATIEGEIMESEVDAQGCAWVGLKLSISVGGEVCTECEVRYALPVSNQGNPWARRGEEWQP